MNYIDGAGQSLCLPFIKSPEKVASESQEPPACLILEADYLRGVLLGGCAIL